MSLDALRKMPRERPVLATCLCALLAFLFPLGGFYQVVVGGKTLSTSRDTFGVNGSDPPTGAGRSEAELGLWRVDPGASAWQTEPWAELASRDRDDGADPLWNPYQGAGKPHAANLISATFDPLLWFVNEHPTPLTWDLSILFAFCLGSLATFLFLRTLALRRIACLVGAALFSVGGYFALYSNNPFARAYIYLPILLLLIDRVIARRDAPWTIALGIGFAASVLVGMPEVSFLVVGTASAYGLYRIFTTCNGVDRARVLGRTGVAALLGMALAAPALLIFARYEPLSWNAHQTGNPIVDYADPLRRLLYWAVPFVNGRPLSGFAPPPGSGSGVRGWVGAGAIVAALTCLAAPFRFVAERRGIFFAIVAAFCVWKIYGLPGSGIVTELPVLEIITWAAFLPPILQFSLAVLAAIGLDAVLRARIDGRRLAFVTAAVVIGGLLALRSSRPALAFAAGDYTLQWVGLAALVSIVVLGAAWTGLARPTLRLAAGVTAALVVLVEIFVLFPTKVYQERVDPYRTPPWQAIVESAQAGDPKVERVFGLNAKLFPDTATALELYDIRTLDGIYIDRYIEYVGEFVSPRLVDRFTGGAYYGHEGPTLYSENPLFDLFGARFLIAGTDGSNAASLVEYVDHAPGRPPFRLVDAERLGDERAALVANGQEFIAPLPTDGRAAKLELSYGLPGAGVDVNEPRPNRDPVAFVVEGIDDQGTRVPLWREELSPALRREVWHDAVIDLDLVDAPIQRVALRVEASERDRGLWLDPQYVDDEGGVRGPQYVRIGQAGGVTVFENPRALPRAFVVRDVNVVRDAAAAQKFLRARGRPVPSGTFVDEFDPRAEAVVEAETSADALAGIEPCPTDRPDQVRITHYEPLEVRLRVDAACAGLLVLSDSYYPAWQATVNGKDATILPTDLLFRGVRVPAGQSTIVFRYDDEDFELGKWTAAAATIVAIAWLVVWRVRRNRASARPAE